MKIELYEAELLGILDKLSRDTLIMICEELLKNKLYADTSQNVKRENESKTGQEIDLLINEKIKKNIEKEVLTVPDKSEKENIKEQLKTKSLAAICRANNWDYHKTYQLLYK
jgi:hypothetical protein